MNETIRTRLVGAARQRVSHERRWMEEHGKTRQGYIERYGDSKAPPDERYGDGGQRIFEADMEALAGAQRDLEDLLSRNPTRV